MLNLLREECNNGVPEDYRRIVSSTYREAETKENNGIGMTKSFRVRVGVHYRSAFSQFLFVRLMHDIVKHHNAVYCLPTTLSYYGNQWMR